MTDLIAFSVYAVGLLAIYYAIGGDDEDQKRIRNRTDT
jgi:hypothetical protein